jgi:glycyl-tRNA synthetase
MPADTAFMDKLTALCKRRGFIYQSSEIYGGIGGFWDYGPLGVELKRNIKDQWWHDMVTNPPDGPDGREVEMVGVDCSIIMNPKVWEASGHATGFADPMVDCRECKARLRADQVWIRFAVSVNPGPNAPWQWLTLDAAVADGESEAKAILGEQPSKGLQRRVGTAEIRLIFVHLLETYKSQKVLSDLGLKVPYSGGEVVAKLPTNWLEQVSCPKCQKVGSLTEPRQFNLMFKTHYGALEDDSSVAYLRPETAQGIFANFKNVLDTTRVKVPFGMAQVGKSFRNEINPRNYTFRSREFEQMEIEFFCHAAESMKWYEFWRKVRYNWYVNLGLKSEKLRLRDQDEKELAHYSKACADIEYLFPFSDEHQELEGVAHRGNYDLTQHAKHSGKDLTYFDDEAWERDRSRAGESPADKPGGVTDGKAGDSPALPPLSKEQEKALKDQAKALKEKEKELKNKEPYRFLPTVIEPSAGADRATLAFLCEAYTEDQAPDEKGVMQTRVVMKFHPKLAPIKAAFFPLVSREGMPDVAYKLYKDAKQHLTAFFDEKGAIGRRYRRQDEVGTPFCVTVDGKTISTDAADPEAGTVTIRERDSLQQIRVGKDQVVNWLREHLAK